MAIIEIMELKMVGKQNNKGGSMTGQELRLKSFIAVKQLEALGW